MSLKTLHIVFITLSALLAGGSAVYALMTVDGVMGFVWAALAVASGVGLVVYGRRFLEKMKQLEAAS
ncbi:MAG: hypothetical protein JJ896_00610 [Rhodothermales bacterium]|nr:hypothetical protein [Rhodothermales bacterium]MBO6778128.1 hypothetical protein [Rhodothermales bacterium]